MSDLCLYGLEDVAWDEFCLSGDHIVPNPSADEVMSLTDSQKHSYFSKTIGDQSTQKYGYQREDKEHPSLNCKSTTMMEKYSWADVPDGMFPSKHDKDSLKGVSSSASENTTTLKHCFGSNNVDSTSSEFLPDGPTLEEKNAAVGENFSYPLGPISQSDNDLSFLDNNHEDKNTNDLLYYSWPEIENFEDVDRIFRSCDSTFGLGASIEDDHGWFSSSDVIEGSGGGLRSDFQFPYTGSSAQENISGRKVASGIKEAGSSINDSGTKDQPLSYNGSSLPSENESSILSHLSFMNGSSDSDCKILHEKKINMHKKYSKHQNQSEGEREDGLENGETFNCNDSLPKEMKHPTAINGTQMDLTSSGTKQQRQVDGPDFGYFQGGFSYLHSDYSHSDQTMVAGIGNENKLDELLHHSRMKLENNGDLEGFSMEISADLRSSIVKEGNEHSEEAASFHQLQHVTERLDIRTKLCIRDSLYRLAQSAEQRHRHQYANLNNEPGDGRDTGGAFADVEENRCTGYLDMETDTNSIDRSIAHLLFHRPSNSSVMPDGDSSALKSPSMVYGSVTTEPMIGYHLTSAGENETETDGVADDCRNIKEAPVQMDAT